MIPNCTCFEPSTSKHRCAVCGDKYNIVKEVPGETEPREDRETARVNPQEFVIPEIFRKFVFLYKQPEKSAEGKPQ